MGPFFGVVLYLATVEQVYGKAFADFERWRIYTLLGISPAE